MPTQPVGLSLKRRATSRIDIDMQQLMLTPTTLAQVIKPLFCVAARGDVLSGALRIAAGVLLCTLFCSMPVRAADGVMVRLEANPESPWVGQKVVLTLDVLAADGWAQLKKTGDVEIKGGYLLRLESQGTRLNETIKGVSYTGQRYEFLFYAQRGGKLSIPEIVVDLEIKSWGASGTTATRRITTPSLLLTVRQPPGTEQLTGIVSTTDFSAKQEWDPEEQSLDLGDAIVRRISLTAADVTGMAFSPLDQTEIAGIAVYLSEPGVEDSYDRGTLIGKRHEKITYLFEQPGEYRLPDLSYSWWNTSAEKLETLILPGLSVQVSGAAAEEASGSVLEEKKFSFTKLIWYVAWVVIFVAVVYRYRTVLSGYFQGWRKAYRESERKYFAKVRTAAQQGDSQAMMRATMQWLDRISSEKIPARLDLFLASYSDSSDQDIYRKFTSEYYGDAGPEDLKKLYTLLARARTAWLKEKRRKQKAESVLPEVGLSGGEE